MRTIFPAAEKIYDMKKIIILIVCVLSACFAAAQEPVPVLTLVLIYISTQENLRKAGVGKSPSQSFLFI